MALSQNNKFNIIGNDICSNIMGMFLKYNLKYSNLKHKIDIYHIKSKENNIFSSYRVPLKRIEENKASSDLNNKFEIKLHNKEIFTEFKNSISMKESSNNKILNYQEDIDNLHKNKKYQLFLNSNLIRLRF